MWVLFDQDLKPLRRTVASLRLVFSIKRLKIVKRVTVCGHLECPTYALAGGKEPKEPSGGTIIMSKRHLKSAVLVSNTWCSFQTWSHLWQLATLFFQWLINSTLPLYLTFYQEISLTVVSKNIKDWTSNYHLFSTTFISRLECWGCFCGQPASSFQPSQLFQI